LKKKGTSADWHFSRMSNAHFSFIGRGRAPDSPPTITSGEARREKADRLIRDLCRKEEIGIEELKGGSFSKVIRKKEGSHST
jgi:hypothetical protein